MVADTTRGRWIIEGDLASYFDTVHHRLLLKCVRRRVQDGGSLIFSGGS